MPTSSPLTTLAGGTVNGTDTTITVELIRPVHMPAVDRTLHPAVVRIVSPLQSTIVDPKHSPEMAAMLTTLFAEAATTLAPKQSPEAAVTAPQPTPRPHGWLWEIMSFLGQLLVGIIIIAALAAAVAWLFGLI